VETCTLRPTLIEARDATAAILERTTLAEVAERGPLDETSYKEFSV
jgi:DNA-binding IscR family transcriptional regulator